LKIDYVSRELEEETSKHLLYMQGYEKSVEYV